MLSSGSSQRQTSSKDGRSTGKLRKACNSCNAAKVKCSGEKPTCARCFSYQQSCIYETSMVGKVPGIRKKGANSLHQINKASQASRQQKPSQIQSNLSRNANHQSETPPPVSGEWSRSMQPLTSYSSLVTDGVQDIFDDPFELDHTPDLQESIQTSDMSYHGTISSTASESTGAGLDFDFSAAESHSSLSTAENMSSVQIPRPEVPVTTVSRSVASPGIASQDTTRSIDPCLESQCVFACCTIVSNLETFIDARCKVLDLSLDVVRKAINSLTQVVDAGASGRSCHMLLGAIMFQLITVLENACASFLDETDRLSVNGVASGSLAHFDSVGGMLSGFGFGGFRVDSGEQRAWRARVVLKEIRQVREVIKRIVALATKDDTITIGETTCHSDVETRLQTLTSEFEKIANS